MSTRRAPYEHADGSNCWTQHCQLRTSGVPASFGELIAQLERPEDREHSEAVYTTVFSGLDQEMPEYYRDHVLVVLHSYWRQYGTPQIGRTRAVFDMGDGRVG